MDPNSHRKPNSGAFATIGFVSGRFADLRRLRVVLVALVLTACGGSSDPVAANPSGIAILPSAATTMLPETTPPTTAVPAVVTAEPVATLAPAPPEMTAAPPIVPVVVDPVPAVPTELQLDATGDQVRRLQQELRDRGYDIDVDGVFGPGTEVALREEQRDIGVDDDGLAGPTTQASLGIGAAAASAYRAQQEFMDAVIVYLNGGASSLLPIDAVTALPDGFDIDNVDWSWSATATTVGGRNLSTIVYSGDGGVYIYGELCTRQATDGTIAWCGIWNLTGH